MERWLGVSSGTGTWYEKREMPEDEPLVNACPACTGLIDVTEVEPYSKVECPNCGEFIRVRADFNHFQIEKQIGAGGMSRVFLAEDVALGRKDALKILNKLLGEDAERVAQFEREALVTASISHPNVVKVFSVGTDQGHFYIAMELVSGGSLEEVITDEGKMDELHGLEVAIGAARGLRAAHLAGLVHRDVKPGNILLAEDGTPKIVDFGLALFSDRDGEPDDGEIWATPYYVPPEVLDRAPDDFRGDIYSLGASFFHALAGVPAFAADTTSVAELKKLKEKPVSLADSAPHLSAETCAVIDRAMAVNPDARFASYDELIEHLTYAAKCVKRGEGTKVVKKNGIAKWAAAGVAALVVGGIFVVMSGSDEEEALVETSELDEPEPFLNTLADGKTISQRYVEARRALANGKVKRARGVFDALAADGEVPEPTRGWSRYNAGIAALLEDDLERANALFGELAESAQAATGDDRKAFDAVVDAVVTKRFPSGSEGRKAAMIAGGLSGWAAGDADWASRCLNAFAASEDTGDQVWLESYRPLVKPYLHDLKVVTPWLFEEGSKPTARTAKEMRAAVAKLSLDTGVSAAARETLVAEAEELDRIFAEARAQKDALTEDHAPEEIERVKAIAAEARGMVEGYDFTKGLEHVRGGAFKSELGKKALDALVSRWEAAAQFLPMLADDLVALEYDGGVVRGTAPVTEGVVSGAKSEGLLLKTDDGEVEIFYDDILPEELVMMAEAAAEKIADSSAYYERRERAAAFAQLVAAKEEEVGWADARRKALAEELLQFRERETLLNELGL